ncbi:MAG: zonular occludens toxin domain-containing protein [Fibrobacter sp.]|nr:zonular occludens toxin domain-containing protein [Fibrobacter sp.]
MPGELLIHYGNPGSGKTLFAMKDIILPCVQNNRPFFTNITGISLSGLSAVSGVHQAFIKYYVVRDIHDVVNYFDNEQISHDGVFILDEMKDFIDDDKAVSWLESRINVMRKHSVDFVLIAQQPKKNYIHPDIISLANACNVFRTRKREKDSTHVTQYYVNGGMPKIVNDDVSNSVGKVVRKKPTEMYSCYETSESKFYTGAEDDTHFGLKWYQERKWKFRFLLIAISVLVITVCIVIVSMLFSFTGNPTKKGVSNVHSEIQKVEDIHSNDIVSAPATGVCYHWKICDGETCKSDIGLFPNVSDIDGPLCLGTKCYPMCEGNIDIPDGGGLLHPGKSVSSGKKHSLHRF